MCCVMRSGEKYIQKRKAELGCRRLCMASESYSQVGLQALAERAELQPRKPICAASAGNTPSITLHKGSRNHHSIDVNGYSTSGGKKREVRREASFFIERGVSNNQIILGKK